MHSNTLTHMTHILNKLYRNFICILFPCLSTNSNSDPVYEDPQLQANPAYGAVGTVKVAKEEEKYEICFQ